MGHRLATKQTEVSWTVYGTITVGYQDCSVCGTETPEPTRDRMIEFCRYMAGEQAHLQIPSGYMWPDADKPGCHPPGWECDREDEWICPSCAAAKAELFAHIRAEKETP